MKTEKIIKIFRDLWSHIYASIFQYAIALNSSSLVVSNRSIYMEKVDEKLKVKTSLC